MDQVTQQAPILGIALISAVIAGKLAKKIHVPQVTAYILIGILMGPSVLDFLKEEIAQNFHILDQIAFGLILFNIGGEFSKELFTKIMVKHVKHSFLLSLLIFLSVSTICYFFAQFTPLTTMQALVCSSFLGIVAIAAAPPTTLLVIKECNSEGPLTTSITVFLAVGTIVAITASHIAGFVYQDLGVWKIEHKSHIIQIALVFWSLFGSFLVGTILGFTLSYWVQKERTKGDVVLAVGCFILFGQAVAYYLQLEPLLISLFLGFALVNTSPSGTKIHDIFKEMGLGIYAIFFILAGAHLHLQRDIVTLGIIGVGYVIARTVGIVISSYISARIVGEEKTVAHFMGPSILSHAGAALAIVIKLKTQSDPSAQSIIAVIMGSIFIFELVGPLLLRFSLIKAGEVQSTTTDSKSTAKLQVTVKEMATAFKENTGIIKETECESVKTIKDLINKDIIAINAKATYNEVVQFLESHHMVIYPVVDDESKYIGLISLSTLKKIGQEASPDNPEHYFTLASKMIGSKAQVSEDITVDEALKAFTKHGLHALPVVQNESHKLLGIIFYKDIVMTAKKSDQESKKSKKIIT